MSTPEAVPALLRPRTSIRRKALRHMLLLAFAMIAGLAFVSFLFMQAALVKRVLAQADAIAAASQDLIENAARDAQYRSVLLASAPSVQKALEGSLTADEWRAFFAAQQADRPDLLGLSLYDASRRRIMTAGETAPLLPGSLARPIFHPVLDTNGWRAYDVITPLKDGKGYLVLRADSAPLLMSLETPLTSLGETAKVYLGLEQAHELLLIHPSQNPRDRYTLLTGETTGWYEMRLPLVLGLRGQSGYAQALDHAGAAVLAAYRPLNILGWGLTVQVGRQDALSSLTALGYALLGVGMGMLLLAALIASILARELTNPLRKLSDKISALKPGAWSTSVSIRTGDEVEVLDRSLTEMARRLQGMYEHLEEEVASRTKELKKQYAFDRAILEGIQHGVVTVDLAGRVTGANAASLSLLGWKLEDIVGKRIEDVSPIIMNGKAAPIAPHPLQKSLKTRKAFRPPAGSLHSIRCADGTMLPTIFLVSPLLQGRRLFGAVLVFQDVRDERRMEELKSEFITLASHQLRTPLSILRWHMDLLVEEHLNASQKSSVDEMRIATGRMANLLNALLQVAQLEGGGLTPKPESLDLHSFLRTVSVETHDIAKLAQVRFLLSAPARGVRVKTDSVLLGIALQNLLTNAIKYSAKGSEVKLKLKRTRKTVEISVEDAGMGIPHKDQRHLFEKFFRAQNVKKVDTDGSGLGLYICKMIIDSLGGSIHMKSEEGKGSTFTIALPVMAKE
jgi:PAS domain S-box-containing protein